MKHTKYDLDGSTVTFDYQQLIETAQIAVSYTREELNREMHKLYGPGEPPDELDAEHIKRHANALAQAITTLSYLKEGIDRVDIHMFRKQPINNLEFGVPSSVADEIDTLLVHKIYEKTENFGTTYFLFYKEDEAAEAIQLIRQKFAEQIKNNKLLWDEWSND